MQLNLPVIICLIAAMLLLILALTIIIVSKITRFINKKRYIFSGKIETLKDVNAFIAHIDLLSFQEKEKDGKIYKYTIVNANTYEKIPDIKHNYKTIDIFPGIYKSKIENNYWYDTNNLINIPAKKFIWEHKDAINQQLIFEVKKTINPEEDI